MKKTLIGAFGSLLAGAGAAFAQPNLPIATTPPSSVLGTLAPNTCDANPCCPTTRFWADAEYLLWRIQNAPIRVPLVTTNGTPGAIGSLNEPGTTILFGAGSGNSNNFGWSSGGRLTVGGWLGAEEFVGAEASGFLLEDRTRHFQAASPGGGAPIVSLPFTATQPFNLNPAGPTSLNAGGGPNAVSVNLGSQLWSAEANGLVNIYSTDTFRLTGLLGFRYIDLRESLRVNDGFFSPGGGTVVVSDGFGTRNQFYGGQLGTRGELKFGRFTVGATAKVALGANHEIMNIGGNTTVTGRAFGFANGTTAGGIFAQPSNIGHFDRNAFAVAPEGQLKLGFLLTSNIHAFAGYNFLYLNNVVRPGNQLSGNVNPTQSAFFVPPGNLLGAPAPLPTMQSSGFWAQGVNFGIELKF